MSGLFSEIFNGKQKKPGNRDNTELRKWRKTEKWLRTMIERKV